MNITIDDEFVQSVAEAILDDELTEEGLADVEEKIGNSLYGFVYEQITAVADFNDLIERNKDAESSLPHYVAYWRNKNAFQPEFRKMGVFATEADAKQFAHHYDIITEFDEWKIVLVEASGESQIYALNLT